MTYVAHMLLDNAGLENQEPDSTDQIPNDDQSWKLPFITLPWSMPMQGSGRAS